MMMPFEWVVGDSSKDHTVTAPTFTTRPATAGYTTLWGTTLWALQTRGGIEHGKISTDELELLNELWRTGWRLRFRTASSGQIPSF